VCFKITFKTLERVTSGKIGPKRPLPGHFSIDDPEDESSAPEHPYREQEEAKATSLSG